MALPSTRDRFRVLTAAAANLTDPLKDEYAQRKSMAWQTRALSYIDLVPELNYASRFYSRMLKQLLIFPGKRNEKSGKVERVYDKEPVEALNRIQDPAGGRAQILGNYGRLMFATGEGLLFGRDLNTPQERWSFVWNDEVVIEETGGTIRKIIHLPFGQSGRKIEYGPNEAVVYRMWSPHPRLSGEADSPMRPSLDIAEELVTLTLAVRATAVSRTTSGLLVMPREISPPPTNTDGDENPDNDPFLSAFVQHLTAQKENVGTAEAVAPFVLWASSDYIDKVRIVKLHDTQNDYAERDLRKEAVERLARGFDFPPEVLLGFGDSNHWSARQVLDDMWRSHGAPIAQQFCDDLNDSYLQPALRDAGYEDWRDILVGYDESLITVKPDRSEDADNAFDRAAIGWEGYRKLKGIPEEYAPSEEERQEIVAIRMRRPEFMPGDGRSQAPADPAQGPPDPGAEGDSGRRTRVTGSATRETGAAEMALHRCREMAGHRILNKGKGSIVAPEGCASSSVASQVGARAVQALGMDARALVAGGAGAFARLLESWGYSRAQSDALAETVELFAARTLFDEHVSLPSSVEAQIAKTKEITDGCLAA